ncbi:uncharacterized protein isoform X2 [Rhodnius prolixus]|uniref:uncharacterized protein isoform X2 n=1 Tax=Rhodnius prolixus TaxID=13249 RepID=UPI003D187C53
MKHIFINSYPFEISFSFVILDRSKQLAETNKNEKYMEQHDKEKKGNPRNKKVARGVRRRGKKPSRKKKKKAKNVEKKTRSGCIYSPYEIFFEKTVQNQLRISDLHKQSQKTKQAPSRRLNLSMPCQEIGNHLCNKNEINIIASNNSKPVNTMNKTKNILKQKVELNCESNSIENGKESNSNRGEDGSQKLQVLPVKNARKRGRKPRKVVTDTEATQQFVVESTSWPSERQSESQLQLFKRTKPCEKEEDERKLNCTTLDIRDTIDINVNENERKNSFEYDNNENGDELPNLNLIGDSNLLDLVFPERELNHIIPEEELGSCIDHGCYSTKPIDYEEHLIKRFKPQCATNCMFTDTDKYIFKSCFKNIQSQLQNFDRYRGAETPGGEASLYDVREASPTDSRKLYRKNFSDLRLNMWYNYVYHSAQLARIEGNAFSSDATSNNSLSLDIQLDDVFLSLSSGRLSDLLLI